MTQIAELPSGRGLRPIDPVRLQAERLSEAYCGLPDGSTKFDLINFVRDSNCEALGVPRSARDMLLTLLRMCDQKHFKTRSQLTGEYGETLCLVMTVTNARLGRERDIGVNRVRCALQALAKAGWISFRDSTTRKRFAVRSGNELIDAYGIDLRPLCARIDDLREAAQVCLTEYSQKRELRRLISQVRNRLAALSAWPALGPCLPEILDAIRYADRARKWSSAETMCAAHLDLEELRRGFEDEALRLAQDNGLEENMMGEPIDNEAQRTASQVILPLESASSFELGGAARPETVLDVFMDAEGADGAPAVDRPGRSPIRAPGIDQLLKTMPTILEAADVRFVAPRILSDPRGLIDTYVRAAEAKIGIDRRRVDYYKDVLGDQGYRVAVLLAAYKPDVLKPGAYVSGLVNRAGLAALSGEPDAWVMDLTKTWYGLYRRIKGEVVH